MKLYTIFLLVTVSLISCCLAVPGHSHKHVKIHVPTRVKKIYVTKFVKVPVHHHYIHEAAKKEPKYEPKKHEYDFGDLSEEDFTLHRIK